MIMWLIILIVTIAGAIACVLYVINRITKFRFIDIIEDNTIYKNKKRTTGKGSDFGISPKRKYKLEHTSKEDKYKPGKSWLRRLIASIIFIVIFLILYLCLSGVEAVVVLLNVAVIWAIVEGIFALLYVCHIDLTNLKVYLPGICAVVISISYMLIANYLGSNVFVTNYNIETDKDIDPIRIVQIADTHLGVTLDKDNFADLVDEINAQKPDIVLITGDYVDDDSMYDDMVAASEALSNINCKYGVYFSYGNHDKGYYDDSGRGYDAVKLEETLKANNVKILEDETEILDNQYIIIGRGDKSNINRLPMSQLVDNIDVNEFNKDYSIVLDHQPNDYDAEAESKVDIVLSGHTHGGQMLPINRIGELIGANDYTYGHKKIDKTDFIVTSGASSWAIRFKTGTKSEIVVIDVNSK